MSLITWTRNRTGLNKSRCNQVRKLSASVLLSGGKVHMKKFFSGYSLNVGQTPSRYYLSELISIDWLLHYWLVMNYAMCMLHVILESSWLMTKTTNWSFFALSSPKGIKRISFYSQRAPWSQTLSSWTDVLLLTSSNRDKLRIYISSLLFIFTIFNDCYVVPSYIKTYLHIQTQEFLLTSQSSAICMSEVPSRWRKCFRWYHLSCFSYHWQLHSHSFAKQPNQGVQSPEAMEFPDFSRLWINSYVCPRLLREVWEHAPPENFKIGLKMNFTQQNSLTFLVF